jgi:serine/threonine protein kinase
MTCCLNPSCANPTCEQGVKFCPDCGSELVLLENRYRPIAPIGRGGFGKTYLAEDAKKFSERCVIKQFAPYAGNDSDTEKLRFRDEAKQLQNLGEHPQIPTLLAFFAERGYLYFVQQYIDGEHLAAELEREGVFDAARVREFLIDLLGILQVVHTQGVIHRDIKPYNIMRRRTDRKLVLIDFGIAKQAEANPATGTSIGSLGYSPLEQFWGGKAYPASDLYSLGVTAIYLMSGISPHQILVRLLEDSPPDRAHAWVEEWRKYIKKPVDDNLGAVIDRLVAVDRHQRYQSTSEVLADLTSDARPRSLPTVRQPSTPSSWRNFKWLAAIGTALLGTALVLSLSTRSPQPPASKVSNDLGDRPEHAYAYLERGKQLSLAHKYPEAIADFNRSIELKPSSAAYLERGQALDSIDDKQGAVADFNAAIKLDPNSAEAYYLRGSRYRDLGKDREALADLDRTLSLQSNHYLARVERGNLHAKMGNNDRAMTDLNLAIQIEARSSYAYMSRAGVYASNNQKDKAIADYDRAIALDPDSYYEIFQRGILHQELNRTDKAKADFQRALAIAKKAGKDNDIAEVTARLKQLP